MRIIGDTNIPFLKYRGIALTISLILILAGIGLETWGPGLNLGIDFVGGTQVTLKFQEAPDLTRIRGTLSNLESGTPVIQQFDEAQKHEILIRVQNPGGVEGDFTAPILKLLKAEYNPDLGDRFDLNIRGAKELSDLLAVENPAGIDLDSRNEAYQMDADAVLQFRRTNIQFSSIDQVDEIEGIRDEVRSYIKENMVVGAFSLLGVDSVGPSVGKDLRNQAIMAIAFSLVGMLLYIWIRFQLPYGLGAVAALFHDVLITLSALAVTGREINLPTVAALLTLVGYSVNDSVVVFDRVRENLRMRRGEDLEDLMNSSINQTLSRTLITSGTTLLVVLSLYLFGGDVINTFAFVLLIGIIVGTYSSVFVASPVALSVSRIIIRRRKARSRR
jgi:preprotein translocase subunit SecF